MKKFYIFLFLMISCSAVYAQAPGNDNCVNAIALPSAKSFCSDNGQYTTTGATPSFTGSGNDVWFTFTPRDGYDLYLTVFGSGNGGTLTNPVIRMFTDCTLGAGLVGSSNSNNNVTTFLEGGLRIGQTYLINISGSNSGTFKLCYQNTTNPVKAGEDCSTAKFLCSMETVRETNVTGAGNIRDEGAGTCLANPGQSSENFSAWFKWTAANNGSLVFTITPTVVTDDLDWALFDLGAAGNCNSKTVIACADGSGVTCGLPGSSGYYYKTGLDFNSTDVSEAAGCVVGQDGKVKYIDMVQGHVYALLVNNPYSSGNGFTIDFTDQNGKAGTGTFVGPQAIMDVQVQSPCTVNQNYTFKSLSTDATSLKWDFGEGAIPATATGVGPYTVTYSTPGVKTAVLEAHGDNICYTIATKTFTVGLKPPPPPISLNKPKFCLGDMITLTTPDQPDAAFLWSGLDGFTAAQRTAVIPVSSYNVAGTYTLTVTINGCTSDPSSITVPPIGKTPVVDFDIVENNPCTVNQSYTFINRSKDFQKLSWSFGNDASRSSAVTDEQFTVTYSSSGSKTITLQEEGDAGCIVTVIKTIDVPPLPPIPQIQSNKPDFCIKDTIRLSTQLLLNTTYRWTGPDNFISDQASVAIPVNSFAVAGTYRLIITQGRCSSDAVSVTIPPILKNPTAAFSTEPSIPAKLSYPVTVKFFNQSADADTYLWDFGDGSTSADANPEHEYLTVGEYDVSLTAFKSDVCNASVIHGKFVIRSENTFFIPNTFTPNGDGINDEFVITITNLKSYHMKIFNRWGEQLFQTASLFDNWKGMYNGASLPVGVYYYIIDVVDLKGNAVRKSGPVTVIR